MKRITLKDKTFKPMISTPHIEEATRGVAAMLNEKFKHETEPVIFLTVLNGAVLFASNLFLKLKFPVLFDTVKVSSYQGTSRGKLHLRKEPDCKDFSGKKVIIVEDIIDTGSTIDYLRWYLEDKGAEVVVASLLIKPNVYKENHPDFTIWGFLSGDYQNELIVGLSIENAFIVGYGLDYDGLGRNLNKIYILDE